MDKFNPDANGTPKPVDTQVPHSGVRNNEFPVREYKETDLNDAVKLPEFKSEFPTGEVVTVASLTGQSPETVEVIENPQTQPELEAKKSVSMRNKVIAWIAGLALVGGGGAVAGNVIANSNASPAPEKNPDDTTQVEPGASGEEKPPVTEEEPTTPNAENDAPITAENEAQVLAELRLTSDMTPEQIGQRYTEVISRWTMAGATPEIWEKQFNEMLDDEALALEIAKNNTKVYAAAIFGEDYKATADSALLTYIANIEEANASNIIHYLRSYSGDNYKNTNTLNEETWHLEISNINTTIESQSDTSLSLTVRQETINNASKTMYRDEASEDNGHIADTYLTLDLTKDVPSITAVKIVDIN